MSTQAGDYRIADQTARHPGGVPGAKRGRSRALSSAGVSEFAGEPSADTLKDRQAGTFNNLDRAHKSRATRPKKRLEKIYP